MTISKNYGTALFFFNTWIREIIGEIDDKIEEKDVESQYIMYVFRDMDKLNPTGEMNGDSV